MLRPLILLMIYAGIVYSTHDMIKQKKVDLGYYAVGVVLSGWFAFAVIDALLRTFIIVLRAIWLLAVGGVIVAPFFYFDEFGAIISLLLLFSFAYTSWK